MFNVRCEIADVRNRRRRPARTAHQSSDIINATSHISRTAGLTLIELLISIAIIATLSAMFLGASRAAMESARASRTKTTILKLHTLIMEQWASYETRRVDLYEPLVQTISGAITNPQARGNAMADLRVLATRELMKFEMPDRWSDVDLDYVPLVSRSGTRDQAAVILESVPTIARTYYRRYRRALDRSGMTIEKVYANQRAECLYMTVMLMTGDGEARTLFSAQDIGDVDEDGLPEFLDGWGNPIGFLRWAPGFVAKSSIMSGDSDADHDPFDPFRRSAESTANSIQWPEDNLYGVIQPYIAALRGNNCPKVPNSSPARAWVGFRLVPLIFSGGPDGLTDLLVAKDDANDPDEVIVSDPSTGGLNPFLANTEGTFASGGPSLGYLGDTEDNFTDNVTNHLQEGR